MTGSDIVFLARRLQKGDDIVINEAFEASVTERYEVQEGIIEFELEPTLGDDLYSLAVSTDEGISSSSQDTPTVQYTILVPEEIDWTDVTSLKIRGDEEFIQAAELDYDTFIESK